MTTIVDYGLGNVAAFSNVYNRLQLPVATARCPADIRKASRLILPGVGAFDWVMERLQASGMLPAIADRVLHEATPILGVCVGMQMLGESSEEGKLPGLGWIQGRVLRLPDLGGGRPLQLPHMGWNSVKPAAGAPLFRNMLSPRFYFLHSYYFECAHRENVLASTSYGLNFASAVFDRNIFGVQFHPEKSHSWGTELLRNFGAL